MAQPDKHTTKSKGLARLKTIAPAIALAAMVLCAYYPATNAGFIWDDHDHFVEDRLTAEPGGLYRIWFDPDPSVWNYWPLSRTSFWIEHRLWGANASAAHAINILLHLAGVLVLYFGLRRFNVPNAWFIAGLFALHPIFVESVAWITERKNVLSGIFYLLSIWSFLNFDDRRRWRWYGAALLLFACCLLSKSSTIMLPVILVFCRLALNRTWVRRDVALLIPFFLLALLSAGTSIWFEKNVIGSSGAEHDQSFPERLALAGRIPFFYLQKILVPYPLIFNYPRWTMAGNSFLAFLPLLGIAAAALILLVKYASSTWGRALFLGLGAFLVTLFPVLGFFDISGMRFSFVADHWVYLPALPILVLIGVGLAALCRRSDTIRRTACAIILAVCGVLTFQHSHAFRDPETLWRDTLAGNPDSWLAHDNLGVLLQNRGRVDEAIGHHLEALRLQPNHKKAHVNLGAARHKQGRMDDAIDHYSSAIRIDPDYANAHLNLGLVLQAQGKIDEAIAEFREVLRITPGFARAHFDLANALVGRGAVDEAITHYLEALRLDPGYAQAHNNLGTVLLRQKKLQPAIDHFREALRISPGYADAKVNLDDALRLLPQN